MMRRNVILQMVYWKNEIEMCWANFFFFFFNMAEMFAQWNVTEFFYDTIFSCFFSFSSHFSLPESCLIVNSIKVLIMRSRSFVFDIK